MLMERLVIWVYDEPKIHPLEIYFQKHPNDSAQQHVHPVAPKHGLMIQAK